MARDHLCKDLHARCLVAIGLALGLLIQDFLPQPAAEALALGLLLLLVLALGLLLLLLALGLLLLLVLALGFCPWTYANSSSL